MIRSHRLFGLLRPYSLQFAATIAATVISSVLDGFTFVLLIPFLRALFGNAALPNQGGTQVEAVLQKIAGPFLQAGSPDIALRNVVVILLVALLLKNLAAYFASMGSVAIQEGVVRDLRVRLFDHLQTLPLGYFQRTRAGQTIARVISDTDQVKTAVSAALASLLQNLVVILSWFAPTSRRRSSWSGSGSSPSATANGCCGRSATPVSRVRSAKCSAAS